LENIRRDISTFSWVHPRSKSVCSRLKILFPHFFWNLNQPVQMSNWPRSEFLTGFPLFKYLRYIKNQFRRILEWNTCEAIILQCLEYVSILFITTIRFFCTLGLITINYNNNLHLPSLDWLQDFPDSIFWTFFHFVWQIHSDNWAWFCQTPRCWAKFGVLPSQRREITRIWKQYMGGGSKTWSVPK